MRVPTTGRLTSALCLAIAVASGVLALTGGDAFAQTGAATGGPADTAAVVPVACDVSAADVPDDGGGAIRVSWSLSEEAVTTVTRFEIFRYAAGEQPCSVGHALRTDREFTDEAAVDGTPYQYFVRVLTGAGSADSEPTPPAVAGPQWFAFGRSSILIVGLLFCAFVLYYIRRARSDTNLFIRKIAGLDAVDDAVGRATEMGRPVLYVPGIADIDDIQTIASLTILSHVAKITAEYETPLIVPTARSVVMSAAEEVVKEAYAEAGHPDNYNPDNIRYLSDAQFAFAGAVSGIMLRERPAANLYLGAFWAESLLFAETGFETKAIQVAGTANVSQLPFFVTACDYTLIGEELYAASAYLSKEPKLLGSLKGSDWMKVMSIGIMILGIVLSLFGAKGFANWFFTQ